MTRTFSLLIAMVLLLLTGCAIKHPDLNDAEADFLNRGIAYYARGQYDHAITYFNMVLKTNPTFAPAYSIRAFCYYRKGQYDKAWEDVHKVQDLGFEVGPTFLKDLRKASGRQK